MSEEASATAVADVSVRLAAVFLPAPLPREGRIAFWDPEGTSPSPGRATATTGSRN